MHDDIIRDNLQVILESIVLIENRFFKINTADDLVSSADGVLLLDPQFCGYINSQYSIVNSQSQCVLCGEKQ
jgi:hypothetical protein